MIPWEQIIKLAMTAAGLLGAAIEAIMSYQGKSAAEKAEVLRIIRQRAQLDNEAVQSLPIKDPHATPVP